MRDWQRARLAKMCGNCGHLCAIGEPVLILSRAAAKWQLVRCAACAGEPVPELPALEPRRPTVLTTPIQPMLAVQSLARDWKAAAIAEREPGEEG